MGLKGFERRLERLVEGVFARAFKSSLKPVELGRRLVREMDDQRTVNVQGKVAAPNDFTITLGPEDHEQFVAIEESLVRELGDAARSHAREEGYVFMGPVEVHLRKDDDLGTGSFGLSARFKEGAGGTSGRCVPAHTAPRRCAIRAEQLQPPSPPLPPNRGWRRELRSEKA